MAGKTILVAEHDLRLKRVLTFSLARHLGERLSLLEASDGRQAIAQALHEHPDLIVLDESLPSPSGGLVCHELKKDPETASIKILMIIRWNRRTPGLLGADAYLEQPFDPAELVRQVALLLKQ